MQGSLWPAFWISAACGALLLMFLLWSIAVPSRRIWPPPQGRANWQFWLVWALVLLLMAGDVTVAIADGNRLELSPPWRATGFALLVLGNALAWWGVAELGGWTTTGLAGPIVTAGPYRFSRNPQYLGDILIAIGVILASESALSILPSLLAALCAFAAPFAEEPWLRHRLGSDYDAYLRRVPRFFGPI